MRSAFQRDKKHHTSNVERSGTCRERAPQGCGKAPLHAMTANQTTAPAAAQVGRMIGCPTKVGATARSCTPAARSRTPCGAYSRHVKAKLKETPREGIEEGRGKENKPSRVSMCQRTHLSSTHRRFAAVEQPASRACCGRRVRAAKRLRHG